MTTAGVAWLGGWISLVVDQGIQQNAKHHMATICHREEINGAVSQFQVLTEDHVTFKLLIK